MPHNLPNMHALPKPVADAITAYGSSERAWQKFAVDETGEARAALEAAIEAYAVERVAEELQRMRINTVGIYGDAAQQARDYVFERVFQMRAIAGIPQPRVGPINESGGAR